LQRQRRNNGYGAVIIYSDNPLPLNELVKVAAAKIKQLHKNDKAFIKILDYHYFERYGVYCVVYVLPEASVLEARNGIRQGET